jgi:hypothetical protein
MEFQVISAISALITLLLQCVLLGVALGVVRKAHAQAAYVVAAAAGLRVLSTCCLDLGSLALELGDQYETLGTLSPFLRIAGTLEFALHWGALAFAAVLLARAFAARGAQGEAVHGS